MKIRTAVGAQIFRPVLPIALAIPFLSASAQSGRVVQPPPTPTPTPQVAPPGRAEVKPQFDSNADAYKLVFPTESVGKRSIDRVDRDRVRHAYLNNFIKQLNDAGSQGYKLISVVASHPLVALVKLDESRHEYDWFETDSRLAFSVGRFEAKYEEQLGRGFHLADHSLLSKFCEDIDPDNSLLGQDCEFRHLFLVERHSGGEKPVRFERARSAPVRGSKPALELTTQVRERLAEGFYPTSLFSAFEVLVEQPAKGEDPPADKPDVQVVRASSFWERDNLEEKVNELARQGYRLAMVNNRIAVMYRPGETATPVTYVWVKATDKRFEKRLAQLQESGAVYRMTYPDDEGDETGLIFEQGAGGGLRRQYQVLKFEFEYTEDAAQARAHIDLTPSGKEALQTLHRLVKEGFAVRDLLYSNRASSLNGASVILERLHKE